LKIILLTLSFELGGSERRAITLARYFKQRGFDVELWGFNGPGVLSKICDENNIPWKVVPFNWYQKPGKRLANLFILFYALKKANPDVLMPHTLIPNTACGLVWRWTGARKCIGYEGGHEFGLTNSYLETLAANLVPLFICNAQHLADEMTLFYNLDKGKIKIIPNGVELPEPMHSRAWWRSKLGVDENTFLAAMVANLSGFKDHETLIRAWRLVLDRPALRDRQTRLLLAGKDFGTEPRLKGLVSDLGMQENVQFLGQVQDIAGLLQSVDIGVYSSRKEGVPNGVLECMQAGLAIAATDGKGIREALGEHQSEWLSPMDDLDRFADNILFLMEDPVARKKIGNRNKERVERDYSPEKMCASTERLVIG
jgi:glycosyltransferase involved in cell wall biosynthesis